MKKATQRYKEMILPHRYFTLFDIGQWFEITNEDIKKAILFRGYQRDEIKWDNGKWLRIDWSKERNAFYIRYLADTMEYQKQWIGPPPEFSGTRATDGNHRLRAVEYLKSKEINIEVPRS